MPAFSDYTFTSVNGHTPIHVRRCDPSCEPIGVVQISHGIAEHIERYDEFAAYLADAGYIVAGNDHLGHGKSIEDSSELGCFGEHSGWELAVGDIHKLHEQLKEQNPSLPCFLFGHSMGSFLSRTYIIRYRSGLSGVILCGTGQQPKAAIKCGKLFSELEIRRHGAKYKSQMLNDLAFGKYNDGFAPARTISDWLSRDTEQVDKYMEDPLCGYIPSAGLFRDMMGGLSYIGSARNISRMNTSLPVLFISGDKDPVGENGRGVMRVYQSFLHAGMTDVTLKLYHDCRHELINELNKADIFSDVLTWLRSRTTV